jgi:hypothetical protein
LAGEGGGREEEEERGGDWLKNNSYISIGQYGFTNLAKIMRMHLGLACMILFPSWNHCSIDLITTT